MKRFYLFLLSCTTSVLRVPAISMVSTAILITMLVILPAHVFAETAEEKGLAIAREIDSRDDGYEDTESELEMILRNRHGQESVRHLKTRTLEVRGDGDKSLSIFNRPRDVKGTAMLTFTHKTGPDDQWLYMPALKRVKRISSTKKSGSFMGSEFANEDLASQEVEKFKYKFIREEENNGTKLYVMERYPVDKHSGYTKQVVWVDLPEYRIIKVDYYDRKKSLLKTLTFDSYKKYLDKYWRPNQMTMVNHQTKKSTILRFKNFKFRSGLKKSDFNKNSLKRAR